MADILLYLLMIIPKSLNMQEVEGPLYMGLILTGRKMF